MSTDNLREFLRNKALSNHPEMEDDWAVLDSKIDLAKKRRRIFSGIIIIAPVILALLLFYNQNQQKTMVTDQSAGNKFIAEKTPSNNRIKEQMPIVDQKHTVETKGSNKTRNHKKLNEGITETIKYSQPTASKTDNGAGKADEPEVSADQSLPEADKTVIEPEKTVVKTEEKSQEVTKPTDEEMPIEKQGQKIKIKGKKDYYKGKWYFQVNASPKLAFRNFSLNMATENKVHKNYQDLRDASEKIRFAYNIGAALEYFISPKLSVQTGIQYAVTGENAKYDFDKTESAIVDPNTGLITGYQQLNNPKTVSFNSNNSYKFIKVPVMLGYNLGFSDNSSFHFASGISYNILSGVSGFTLDKVMLEKQALSKQNSELVSRGFDYNLGFGFSYALNHRYGLIFDMYFNKTLNNISADEITVVKPYSSGVNIALSRKLY